MLQMILLSLPSYKTSMVEDRHKDKITIEDIQVHFYKAI